jgi:hypothetical protein
VKFEAYLMTRNGSAMAEVSSDTAVATDWIDGLVNAVRRIRESVTLSRFTDGHLAAYAGTAPMGDDETVATLPPFYPEWLGDRSFSEIQDALGPDTPAWGANLIHHAGAIANGRRRLSNCSCA